MSLVLVPKNKQKTTMPAWSKFQDFGSKIFWGNFMVLNYIERTPEDSFLVQTGKIIDSMRCIRNFVSLVMGPKKQKN